MTTLPTDFIRLHGPAIYVDLNCHEHGLVWPPPDTITHLGTEPFDIPFAMVTRSTVSDEEAAATGTTRGAYYIPITDIEEGD